jgi:hypothetical protein
LVIKDRRDGVIKTVAKRRFVRPKGFASFKIADNFSKKTPGVSFYGLPGAFCPAPPLNSAGRKSIVPEQPSCFTSLSVCLYYTAARQQNDEGVFKFT